MTEVAQKADSWYVNTDIEICCSCGKYIQTRPDCVGSPVFVKCQECGRKYLLTLSVIQCEEYVK